MKANIAEATAAIARLRARYPHPTGTNYHLDLDTIAAALAERGHGGPGPDIEPGQISAAIQGAGRCPRFMAERGDPCDGLEGCNECLRLAAVAVSESLSGCP